MATIYKKKYPIPMPEGAEIIRRQDKRLARWTSGKGQVRTAEVLPDGRIQFVSDCWYIRYRNAEGRERRESTGCRDKQAASKVLADVMANVEKARTGIYTQEERELAGHANGAISEHMEDYLSHLARKRLRGRKISVQYRKNVRSRLLRLFKECGFRQFRDLSRQKVEKWLDLAETEGMAAATRNEYLISLSAMCNWAMKTGRLANNPVAGIGKADRSSDRRRIRRAMTLDEILRLLDAARRRPIAEVGRASILLPAEERCGRSSWTFEELTDDNSERCYQDGLARLEGQGKRLAKLKRLGQKRSMFYLLAVSTGLRHKELASLTIGQVHLDATPTYLALYANDAKSGKAANIPLRADVVAKLRTYLASWCDLPLDEKLFKTPPTIRVFDADIQAAGIPKKDARGWIVDIHALRHTFGTHLSAAGVHPRTAMAAMRHSRIELTMNYYTDPVLLDVAGAVEALPAFGGN